MLNAVKSVLAEVLSVSPLSEQRSSDNKGLMLKASANILFMVFSISTSTLS